MSPLLSNSPATTASAACWRRRGPSILYCPSGSACRGSRWRNGLTINHAGTKLRGVLDGTQLIDLTEAERYSRRQAIQIVQALREFGGPAFAKVQLAATGPQVGVRETRRVRGLYVLTEEDAKSGRRFEDAIAWRSGFLDIGYVRFEKMQVHDVPYRALVPGKMDGLLVAGALHLRHPRGRLGRQEHGQLHGHRTRRRPRRRPVRGELQSTPEPQGHRAAKSVAGDGVDLRRA